MRYEDLVFTKMNELDLMRFLPRGNYICDSKYSELSRKMDLATEKQIKISKNLLTNLEKDAKDRGVNMGKYQWLEKKTELLPANSCFTNFPAIISNKYSAFVLPSLNGIKGLHLAKDAGFLGVVQFLQCHLAQIRV